jgi:hypothetical protein
MTEQAEFILHLKLIVKSYNNQMDMIFIDKYM